MTKRFSQSELYLLFISWLSGKKILKLTLFGKMKKKGNIGVMKQSKSASDITQGILDRKDDFR